MALTALVVIDLKADAHQHSVARIFPRLGETGTARVIIDRLDQEGSAG